MDNARRFIDIQSQIRKRFLNYGQKFIMNHKIDDQSLKLINYKKTTFKEVNHFLCTLISLFSITSIIGFLRVLFQTSKTQPSFFFQLPLLFLLFSNTCRSTNPSCISPPIGPTTLTASVKPSNTNQQRLTIAGSQTSHTLSRTDTCLCPPSSDGKNLSLSLGYYIHRTLH